MRLSLFAQYVAQVGVLVDEKTVLRLDSCMPRVEKSILIATHKQSHWYKIHNAMRKAAWLSITVRRSKRRRNRGESLATSRSEAAPNKLSRSIREKKFNLHDATGVAVMKTLKLVKKR